MSDSILVQPPGLMGWMPPERVEGLLEDLKAEGLHARISYDEEPSITAGGGTGPVEVVFLWVAVTTGGAVINQVVQITVEWMRERFRRNPEDTRLRKAHIILYDGEEGEVSEVIELKSADEKPVRRSPEGFERYTRKKPREGVRWWRR